MESKTNNADGGQRGNLAHQHLDRTQAVVTVAILGFFSLSTILSPGSDRKIHDNQSEQGAHDDEAPQDDLRIPLVFTLIALIGATAIRIGSVGIQSVKQITPSSFIINILKSAYWAEAVSPIALSFYTVALVITMTSYLDDPETFCRSSKDFNRNVTVGDWGHYDKAAGIWLIHFLVCGLGSGLVLYLWPRSWPGSRTTWRWLMLYLMSLGAIITAVLVAGPCAARTFLWRGLFYSLSMFTSIWFLANWRLILGQRLNDMHIELPLYALSLYLIAQAPVHNFCQPNGC